MDARPTSMGTFGPMQYDKKQCHLVHDGWVYAGCKECQTDDMWQRGILPGESCSG